MTNDLNSRQDVAEANFCFLIAANKRMVVKMPDLNFKDISTVLLTGAYLFWPAAVILAIMLAGGPTPKTVLEQKITILVLCYPIFLSFAFLFLPWRYFGIHPGIHIPVITFVVLAGLWVMGFLRA